MEAHLHTILRRKGQVILYGPPGTGKTYHARRTARELVTRDLFPRDDWARLTDPQRQEVDRRITFCTFHPAYAYEEFIEGYRPVVTDGAASFERRDGLFLEACERARREPSCHHVLIVDEINRGNVAAVLGELITLLEMDKRQTLSVRLPLSGREFTVPRNLWVIGTMNTADRSIALLDAALRRRFGFVELLPEPERLDAYIDELNLAALLRLINGRVRQHVPRNARELQVGHAYFMREGHPIRSREELLQVMWDDVLPLLSEYCFENYGALREILGEELVDVAAQVTRANVLGDPDRLHRALLGLVSGEPAVAPPGEGEPVETPEALEEEPDEDAEVSP